jgi:glycosyltransferase involved in cell wall biosynthesis
VNTRLAKETPQISVVIPALDAADHLAELLRAVESQTLPPREVVLVDSSRSDRTEKLIRSWRGRIPVIYRRVGFAYPGHARNLGVAAAGSDWVAFLDCRTLPAAGWLLECATVAEREGVDFVGGAVSCSADTFFKMCLMATTYGGGAVRSLPGSLVRRSTFEASGGFVADVRAGEDIDWLGRLAAAGVRMKYLERALLRYDGFPPSLAAAMAKWRANNIAAARIDVRNNQKMIYLTALMLLLFLLGYRWNALFAHWREDSIFYIPNITKGIFCSVWGCYVLYRGLARPLMNKVPLHFLLPWRWTAVCFVGLCLDLAKTPGMLLGAWILLRKRLGLALSVTRTPVEGGCGADGRGAATSVEEGSAAEEGDR